MSSPYQKGKYNESKSNTRKACRKNSLSYMDVEQTLTLAIKDYKFLLDRGYPQKSILKMVGDKYQLSGTARSVLHRGVCSSAQIKSRKKKKIGETDLKNQVIHIDLYNILFVIGSYLNGTLVFVSNDGFLRDTSELHGKIFRKINLMLAFSIQLDTDCHVPDIL
jgi:hypothetical protein